MAAITANSMELNLGILCGLIAMLAFGISNGLAKAPSQKLRIRTFICYRNGIVSLLLLAAFFLLPLPFTFSLHYALIALAIGAAGYIPLAAFYAALSKGKTGVVTPIANASVLFTVLFSMFFFNERLTTQQTIALVMIIAGIITVSLN